MAEFEEGFKGKEDVNSVSAKRKYFLGVSRKGDKWQARIRHPKLKVEVHLGYYSSREEAALAVRNKKAEFEEMLKGVDGLRDKRRRHEFEGRKLPCGVRRDRGKFRVRIWHPELKRDVSFGAYSTWEEAAVVVDRKRAELRELYGGKPRDSSEYEHDDKVLQETDSEEASVVADSKREVYGAKVRGSGECEDDDEFLHENESEEDAVVGDRKTAELWEMFGEKPRSISVCEDDDKVLQETEIEEGAFVADRKQEVYGVKVRGSGECEDDDDVLQETESEEAAVVADGKTAELWKMFGAKPRSISECEDDDKVLQETESEEAAVVADRKREVYGVKVRGSGECEDDDEVLEETESEGATVVADRKTAELWEMFGEKPRSISECEDDDKVLQETESEEAAIVADMKREVYGVKVRGSGECEDDDEVLQETESEEAAVIPSELWEMFGEKPRSISECEDDDKVLQETESEEAALVVKNKIAEFEETLNGEDGLRMKRRRDEFQGCKLPSGVRSEGGMFRVRIWHPVLKRDASFGSYSTCEEAAVVADGKRDELRGLYVRKPRGSSECEDDDKVLQETESEVAGKFECSDEQTSDVKGPAGVRRVRSGRCVSRIKVPVSNDRIWLGTCNTPEEAIRCYSKEKAELDTKMNRAEYEEKFKGKEDVNIVENETCDGVSAKRKQFLGVSKKGNKWQARIRVEKRRRHEFEGRQLPKGITRECGKFRVRLWHPELKKYASFGYYNSCDEAVVVADRKRAELQDVYEGKPRGSRECEDDDKVLQETESEEAAVVADMKRAELREVYREKVRGSGVCEDDDEEVLQESTSEVAGNFECADKQASDVKVPARIKDPVSNDRILLGTCDTLSEANRCFSKEKTVLDTKMKRAEFEEQFKGKEDVNIVEDETCDGVLAKTKHFLGVSRKGNKWQARVRHPELKILVYLGYYSTPEEAALVVKNKKAEFEETLKGVDGLWKKRCGRPGREFERRNLSRGVRRDRGKFRVRIWHPELKKDISFGAYSTYEEAIVVADRKRAELLESYGGKPGGSSECEDDDKVLQECESSKGGGSH